MRQDHRGIGRRKRQGIFNQARSKHPNAKPDNLNPIGATVGKTTHLRILCKKVIVET